MRTFSMLDVKGLAVYWIPYCRMSDQTNPFTRPDTVWTENSMFKQLNNNEFIAGSLSYVK